MKLTWNDHKLIYLLGFGNKKNNLIIDKRHQQNNTSHSGSCPPRQVSQKLLQLWRKNNPGEIPHTEYRIWLKEHWSPPPKTPTLHMLDDNNHHPCLTSLHEARQGLNQYLLSVHYNECNQHTIKCHWRSGPCLANQQRKWDKHPGHLRGFPSLPQYTLPPRPA